MGTCTKFRHTDTKQKCAAELEKKKNLKKMEISSNQRKASAPPALNIKNNNSGIPKNKKSHADKVRTHINDDLYQKRVKNLAAKTDKLINSHKKAVVNSG